MRIYHTETQEDYDALMIELEEQGCECEWTSARKPTEVNRWHIKKRLTCIRVYDSKVYQAPLNYYQENYPNVSITKYKAKTDTSVKFTKENVEAVITDWFWKDGNSALDDLVSEIRKLDDTPEKVAVPKYVAEWIEWNKETGADLQTALKCYRHYCDNTNAYSDDVYGKKAVQWYVDNPYKFIQAYEKGYTIEPEQLYYIPLPDLETSDGKQQVLSKRKNHTRYFACCPSKKLKQRYTKEELEQVPEAYKPYATPVEEDGE